MNMNGWKTPLERLWVAPLVAVLLTALTFPAFELNYGVGLDSSYVWGLNWLFDHDYTTLTHLVYPYGPLALLRLPVAEGVGGHFLPFLLFFTVVKLAFVWLILVVARRQKIGLPLALVPLIPACIFGNIDTFVVLDVTLLVFLAVEERKTICYVLASLLASVTLCIKSSIGLQACSVLFVGWVIDFVRQRNWRRSVMLASIVLLALIAVGLLVYRGFETMLQAYWGVVALTAGYSEAMVLIVEHRLWALLLFAVAMLSLPWLSKAGPARTMWLLLLIPLIANWKYGIVREDFWHFKQLVYFTFCFVAAVLVSQRGFRWQPWAASAVAVAMIWVNLDALRYEPALKATSASPLNIASFTIGYDALVQKSLNQTESALSLRRLPHTTLERIGKGTVDCYPWEHIFVAANNLRWQPRITLGAGFSPQLSRLAAANYSGEDAVKYIIFHRPNYSDDHNLYSIDGAWLLNDEPLVLYAILENYTVVDTGWYGLLLQHSASAHSHNAKKRIAAPGIFGWNQWISLPPGTSLTAIEQQETLIGRLVQMVYKPDINTVDYLLPDSTWRTYRYSPVMAQEGLWTGPMVASFADLADLFADSCRSERPIAIRLNTLHPAYHKDSVKVQFYE